MRSFFIILFCVFFSCLVNGQIPSGGREATEKEQKLFESSNDCVKLKSISLTKRLKLYPFNNTNKIQLVSFKSSVDSTFGEYYKDSLPRKNDTICYSKLYEVKTLENSQLDSLTDIIYNYGFKFKYKGKRYVYFIGSVLQCYNPRNAILFLDKDNNVFEYIEICFECKKTRTSSDKVSLSIDCNQKLQLVKKVFKDNGIKYGVTEN